MRIKGFQKGHETSQETRRKIGLANSKQILFNCDYCGKQSSDRKSHYETKKRHFCSNECYHQYRKYIMKKEEQSRYGTGFSVEERSKREQARIMLNHYLRDKHIERKPCEICGEKAEAHHDNYDKPLEVRWLCFKHHRQWHKAHENPELLQEEKP